MITIKEYEIEEKMMNKLLEFIKTHLPERKLVYSVRISKIDAKESEYYADTLYPINNNENEMIMKVKLKPSKVKKGLVFFSNVGLMFRITSINVNKGIIKAERVFSD